MKKEEVEKQINSKIILIIVIIGMIVVAFAAGIWVAQISGEEAIPERKITVACEILGDTTISEVSGNASSNFCSNELIAEACRNAKENFNAECQSSCEIFEKHSFEDGEDIGGLNIDCDKDVDQTNFKIMEKSCTYDPEKEEGFKAVAICIIKNICNCDP